MILLFANVLFTYLIFKSPIKSSDLKIKEYAWNKLTVDNKILYSLPFLSKSEVLLKL